MIPLFKPYMAPEAGRLVQEVLYSGQLAEGPKVKLFEKDLCDYLDLANAVATNSGTAAITLACRLAGVTQGSYVVSTPMTCTATNTAIAAAGGHILWADVLDDGNMDPFDLDEVLDLNPGVTAVVCVHWAGRPAALSALREVCKKYGVKLIEDAAHAFGAHYGDVYIGNKTADYTCFSFQAIKHLTCGDGGALVCKDSGDVSRAKRLRWFGLERDIDRDKLQDPDEWGWKFHMNDIAATIGIANLREMNTILSLHRHHVRYLDSVLGNDMDSQPLWVYPLRVPNRAQFMKAMWGHGIATSVVHARNDKLRHLPAPPRDLPGVDAFDSTQVNVPCGWWLSSEDITYIGETIRRLT
jgi:perosamine synthetase